MSASHIASVRAKYDISGIQKTKVYFYTVKNPFFLPMLLKGDESELFAAWETEDSYRTLYDHLVKMGWVEKNYFIAAWKDIFDKLHLIFWYHDQSIAMKVIDVCVDPTNTTEWKEYLDEVPKGSFNSKDDIVTILSPVLKLAL